MNTSSRIVKYYFQQIHQHHGQKLFLVFLIILLLGFAAFQLITPIRMGDTDMWYHLNGGRYFWQVGEIADSNFFSFISPERQWTNYYWGFQASIYQIFQAGGYLGLIVFRTLIVFATAILIFAFLRQSQNPQVSRILLLALFCLILIILHTRTYQVRPHLFSYFFIITFIYILEYRPRLAPVLPLATIVWINMHGIEWPVGALICASYALPEVYRLLSHQPLLQNRWFLPSLFLCGAAMFVNPHGTDIVLVPFNLPPDISQFIAELKPFNSELLYSLQIKGLQIHDNTALTLLILAALTGLIFGLVKKLLRVEHLLLTTGGFILMWHANRFIWEWLLLSLPVIALLLKHPGVPNLGSVRQLKFSHLLLLPLLLTPFISWHQHFQQYGSYPFDSRRLPTGTATFLVQQQASGKLVSSPSQAGFLEWSLYPQIKTYADMQFPPFTAADFFAFAAAYRNETALQNFLELHQPDWLAVPNKHQTMADNLKQHPQYVAVFTDDVQVLYANRESQPDIAARQQLLYLNPHDLRDASKGTSEQRIAELKRLQAIEPDSLRINHALTRQLFSNENYAEALVYAELLQQHHPKHMVGYYLAGLSHHNLNQFTLAIASLQQALPLAKPNFRKTIQRDIGISAYLNEDFDLAYDSLQQGLNPYEKAAKPAHLYAYAFSALMTGQLSRAERLLRMIPITAPDKTENQQVIANSRELLEKLEAGEFAAPGLFDWLGHYFAAD
ncbi:MAG: hypothetical protein PVG66_03750 [Chromatiales bacterium]|jgi:Flp pilus assembly protein TadD